MHSMTTTAACVERFISSNGRVLTIDNKAVASEAAAAMRDHKVGCLVVVNAQAKPVGIVTERDIITRVVAGGMDATQVPVASIMTETIVCCTPEASVTRAQQLMGRHKIRHLPIMDGNRLVGMISSRDILDYQLSTVTAIAQQQSKLIHRLEKDHPGITQVDKDQAGRIMISE